MIQGEVWDFLISEDHPLGPCTELAALARIPFGSSKNHNLGCCCYLVPHRGVTYSRGRLVTGPSTTWPSNSCLFKMAGGRQPEASRAACFTQHPLCFPFSGLCFCLTNEEQVGDCSPGPLPGSVQLRQQGLSTIALKPGTSPGEKVTRMGNIT